MMRRILVLLLLGLVGITEAGQYLGSPPFSDPTEHGMSYARKPLYEYEFDPEMYLGYNRQDNADNGTSLSASGYYILTQDIVYIRIDQRDCRPSFSSNTSNLVCLCYEVPDKSVKRAECKSKPGFTPFCMDHFAITFTDPAGGYVSMKKASMFLTFTMKNEGDEENLIHVTNYLGDGLHQANPNHLSYIPAAFRFSKIQHTAMKPKIIPRYLFGKKGTVNTINFYFPSCARIDYSGLMYGGDLLSSTYEQMNYVKPLSQPYHACPDCRCDDILQKNQH